MKFLGFLITFLILYAIINFYLILRGFQCFPSGSLYRWIYLPVILIIVLSFPAGKLLEHVWISYFNDILVWIGSFWFAAMFLFLIFALFIDLFRLVNLFLPVIPKFLFDHVDKTKLIILLVGVCGISLAMILGHLKAHNIKVKNYNILLPQKYQNCSGLRIVVASDLHVSTTVGRKRCKKIVNLINAQKPNIILLPGDIVDSDLKAVTENNLGDYLKELSAPLGVYACPGNHEYIGGIEQAIQYLTDHNIRVLRDEGLTIHDYFYLIGRDDPSFSRYSGKNRASLESLTAQQDTLLPSVVMDHQPLHLEEASRNKVFLQVSGHTHRGQFWPFNWATDNIYECSHGYIKKDD
ncbi:metallophosphoesterase, partial [bacterium]|nr:metallophosphoesterase [bacterium]